MWWFFGILHTPCPSPWTKKFGISQKCYMLKTWRWWNGNMILWYCRGFLPLQKDNFCNFILNTWNRFKGASQKIYIYNSTMVAVGLVCFPMCTCDCWWKRSCTSWCVVYPIFYMVLAHPRWCMISSINRSTTNHNLSPGRFQSVSPLRASRDPFSWIQAKRCILGGIWGIEKMYPVTGNGYISHLGKRNIIFKSTLVTGYVSSFQGG